MYETTKTSNANIGYTKLLAPSPNVANKGDRDGGGNSGDGGSKGSRKRPKKY